MIKFSKVMVIAGSVMACSAAFAQSGSGTGISGSGGTGVDILIGATISANNPGVSLPGSSDSAAYGDSGVGRGIASLDTPAGEKTEDKQ